MIKIKNILWSLIQATGDFLVGKLPSHPNHPKGRNPYAHIALKVKNKFGLSYKDIPRHNYEINTYLEFIKKDEG